MILLRIPLKFSPESPEESPESFDIYLQNAPRIDSCVLWKLSPESTMNSLRNSFPYSFHSIRRNLSRILFGLQNLVRILSKIFWGFCPELLPKIRSGLSPDSTKVSLHSASVHLSNIPEDSLQKLLRFLYIMLWGCRGNYLRNPLRIFFQNNLRIYSRMP